MAMIAKRASEVLTKENNIEKSIRISESRVGIWKQSKSEQGV